MLRVGSRDVHRHERGGRQVLFDGRACALVQPVADRRLDVRVALVRFGGVIRIARRFHGDLTELRAAFDQLIVGDLAGGGDAVHVHLLDVGWPRVVGVRAGNGQLDDDLVAAPRGGDAGGRRGQVQQRRQRRPFLAAARTHDDHGQSGHRRSRRERPALRARRAPR
jgi:hypothetical protein